MNENIATRLLHSAFNDKQVTWAIRTLFVISVLLIVVLSVSYHSINRELLFYSDRVDHTHDVIDEIQKIRVTMYETTYSGRGFLLLGDKSNQQLMLAKVASLSVLADSLRRLISDNPSQIKRTEVLKDSLRVYEVRIVRFAGSNPLRYTMDQKRRILDSGGALTKNINRQLDKMEAVEDLLRLKRTENRDSYKQQIFRFNWVIMVVALVFLLTSFLLLERELKTNKIYKAELENKVDNLNRSNSELEQFAYVASHDLQEPLRKIRSFSDLIKARTAGKLEGSLAEMLGKIDLSASRMQMLINDLLSFSRSLQSITAAEPVDLNKVLNEVRAVCIDKIDHGIDRVVSTPLPTIVGYELQLNQLFQNIISNSIKYRKKDGNLLIEIYCEDVPGSSIPGIRSAQAEDLFHKITFQDNGIGFSNDYNEKIFVIFQRLHGSGAYEGSGIGLAICRKVIFNHKGYITADGKENSGAKFCVYLPKSLL